MPKLKRFKSKPVKVKVKIPPKPGPNPDSLKCAECGFEHDPKSGVTIRPIRRSGGQWRWECERCIFKAMGLRWVNRLLETEAKRSRKPRLRRKLKVSRK